MTLPISDSDDRNECVLRYNEAEHWLQATWCGYTNSTEAWRSTSSCLRTAEAQPSPLLLNDSSQLYGPWFNSLEWLVTAWAPEAGRLGLRYVAHVMQPDQFHGMLTEYLPLHLPFELQVFQNKEDASHWLRQCRERLRPTLPPPVATPWWLLTPSVATPVADLR